MLSYLGRIEKLSLKGEQESYFNLDNVQSKVDKMAKEWITYDKTFNP